MTEFERELPPVPDEDNRVEAWYKTADIPRGLPLGHLRSESKSILRRNSPTRPDRTRTSGFSMRNVFATIFGKKD